MLLDHDEDMADGESIAKPAHGIEKRMLAPKSEEGEKREDAPASAGETTVKGDEQDKQRADVKL